MAQIAHSQMLTRKLWKSWFQRRVRKTCQQSIFCTHHILRSSNYTKQTVLFSSGNLCHFSGQMHFIMLNMGKSYPTWTFHLRSARKDEVLFLFCFLRRGWFVLRRGIKCDRQYFCSERCGVLRLLNFESENVSAVVVM